MEITLRQIVGAWMVGVENHVTSKTGSPKRLKIGAYKKTGQELAETS